MDFKSPNFSEAYEKFSKWIDTNETKLNSSCYCNNNTNNISQNHHANNISTTIHTNNHNSSNNTTTINNHAIINTTNLIPNNRIISWKNVIDQHQKLQNEVEEFGKQLNCELKRHLHDDKSLGQKELDSSADLEERWHKLWLKSLEQLVVVERTKRCPKHNSTMIGKPYTKNLSPANMSMSKPQRRRPISYPTNTSERLEWDYDHTLSLTGCHKENGSQVDLDSVDELVTKNLTEFGENYELWFGKEDEIACVATHSRPQSVEPAEKPELAKAVVTSTNSSTHEEVSCNLLMLTTPSSMFSVDASKSCLHNNKRQTSYAWRIFAPILLAVILLLFSNLYQDPHHVHRSYYHNQPPV